MAVNTRNLDFALQWDTEAFLQGVKASLSRREVVVPAFLHVLRDDLGKTNKEYLQWLCQFVRHKQEEKLLLLVKSSEDVKIVQRRFPIEHGLRFLLLDLESPQDVPVDSGRDDTSDVEDEAPAEGLDLPTEVEEAIAAAQQQRAAVLDLASSALIEVPPTLLAKSQPDLRRLELSYNQLSNLPHSFGLQLLNLAFLYLAKNKLKVIPACLGELRGLEYCDLSANRIGYIPTSFCSLRHLKTLLLNDNELEQLPIGFAQLRGLEELNLASNRLTALPYNFGEMNQLETVDLHSNQLTVMPDLTNLILLEEISFKHNKLREMGDFGKDVLPSLLVMDLSHNEIAVIPSSVANLVYLSEMNLTHNKLTSIPPEVCDMLSLRTLDLDENEISDPPQRVWSKGLTEIRKHFGWNKELLPQRRAAKPGQPEQGRGKDQATPSLGTLGKSLSTREKRALLMVKTKTTRLFDPAQLSSMREKYASSDINAMLADAQAQADLHAESAPNTAASDASSPQAAAPALQMDAAVKSRNALMGWLVVPEKIDKYWVELPGSVLPEVRVQDFNFLPDYQKHFHHKGHANFFGVSPTLGPVVVSVVDIEAEMQNRPEGETKGTTPTLLPL